jgi:hypothetical protein
MTLHAYLELPFQRQPRRINDVRFARRSHVLAPRPVAPLTIDALGDTVRRHQRICVVAEEAVVGDGPAEAHVVGRS